MVAQSPEHAMQICGGDLNKAKFPNSSGLSTVRLFDKRSNLRTGNGTQFPSPGTGDAGAFMCSISNCFKSDTGIWIGKADLATTEEWDSGNGRFMTTVSDDVSATAVSYRAMGDCVRIRLSNAAQNQSGTWTAAPELPDSRINSEDFVANPQALETIPGATDGSMIDGVHMVLAQRPRVHLDWEVAAQPANAIGQPPALNYDVSNQTLRAFPWSPELFYPAQLMQGHSTVGGWQYVGPTNTWPVGPAGPFQYQENLNLLENYVDRGMIYISGIADANGDPLSNVQFGYMERVKLVEITFDGKGQGSSTVTTFVPAVPVATRPAQVVQNLKQEALHNMSNDDAGIDVLGAVKGVLGVASIGGEALGAMGVPGAGAVGLGASILNNVIGSLT